MDLLPGEPRKTRVVDLEAEVVEELGEALAVGLLFVDAEGEGLDAAEEEERVEGGEGVADAVDGEGDSLFEFFLSIGDRKATR